jgi:hypothetical protein
MEYLQVSTLGGNRDETRRGQGIIKRSGSWNLPKRVNCDGIAGVSDQVPHRTTYGQNNSWVVQEIPAEWLSVSCETNRPAGAIGRRCWAFATNCSRESSGVNTSCEQGVADASSQVSGAFCPNIFARKDTGCTSYYLIQYQSYSAVEPVTQHHIHTNQGRLQGCAACAAAQGAERVGAPILIINLKIRARYMAADWNTIERKANGKLTENTGTECERDLTPRYFRWAKPRDQVASVTVVVYFIDNRRAFVSHQLFSVAFITLIIDNFTCHVQCSRKFHRNLRIEKNTCVHWPVA